jgi:hypothetical protein
MPGISTEQFFIYKLCPKDDTRHCDGCDIHKNGITVDGTKGNLVNVSICTLLSALVNEDVIDVSADYKTGG